MCTNLGGTPELVGKNGIILNVDKFWETRYLKKLIEDLDNLKPKVVAEGIHNLLKIKSKPNVSKYDINLITKQYVKSIKKELK